MTLHNKSSQMVNTNTPSRHRVAFFALIALLAACQPAGKFPAEANTPAAKPATTAIAPQASITPSHETADNGEDEASSRPRPDASYTTADLRPSYVECVNATNGNTFDLQACGEEELAYHRNLVRKAVAIASAQPDSKEKDKWMDAQAAWVDDTERYCTFDPATEGQGQLLDAQSCHINRFANRAKELQPLLSQK